MSDTACTPVRSRRAFIEYFASIGLGSTLLPGILWGQAAQGAEITSESVAKAAELAGLEFDDDERAMMVAGLEQQEKQLVTLHGITLTNDVVPAVHFNPVLPGITISKGEHRIVRSTVAPRSLPASHAELAFLPVTELSSLVRRRKVTSEQLTRVSLDRLQEFDPKLHCVITLTADRALEHARAADEELRRGRWRGPLHGIPWGAKDLLAVPGYPTTWGAGLYQTQQFEYEATVVKRLDEAGAILVAKLTLGSLAQGNHWWKDYTRNPWIPEQLTPGASGSSAGPGSAVASGCVAFAIGSETNGSITSPSRTNGITGHRPSFGRVPRTGAMALSWTTDKLGPMCRSAEDCALVFDAIQGPDGFDRSVKAYPFNWNAATKLSSLRIGYFKSQFERRGADGNMTPIPEAMNFLKVIESLGAKLEEVAVPEPNYGYLDNIILNSECGAAFEVDTLNSKIKELEPYSTWPNTFRGAQFVPAVDYVNANRARVAAMNQMWDLFSKYDVILTPQENTSVTNITGTPSVVVPTGFAIPQPFGGRGGGGRGAGADTGRGGAARGAGGPPAQPPVTVPLPTSIAILGPIFQDEKNLIVAHAFQSATDFHKRYPPKFG
jgi:Asp-tRNA(Asn)/Glu-tRNA(Gln) amidotransferase A subunit family amidase